MQKILIILEAGKIYPSGITRGLIYRNYLKNKGYRFKFVNRNSPFLLQILIHPPSLMGFTNQALSSKIAYGMQFMHSWFINIFWQYQGVST